MGAMPADADRLVRHGLGHRGLSGNRRAGRLASRRARLAQLREMAREWPAFRTLLSNMEMVLAKSDLAIAARYAQLVRALRERIFGAISAEHGRTLAMLCC